MYLLDTHVVFELRKPKPHGAVVRWVQDANDADLRICAVTVGEIQAGIEITREQDEAEAAELERWLAQVSETFAVIPMDARTFREWARLMHRASDTLVEDAMIAATARVHGLIVVTRNVAEFRSFGVEVLNPFETPRATSSDPRDHVEAAATAGAARSSSSSVRGARRRPSPDDPPRCGSPGRRPPPSAPRRCPAAGGSSARSARPMRGRRTGP